MIFIVSDSYQILPHIYKNWTLSSTLHLYLLPVYQSPVKLVIVELKLDGEVDDDDVGRVGLGRRGLGLGRRGRFGWDQGEGGEGGSWKVLAVLQREQESESESREGLEELRQILETWSVTRKNFGILVSSVRLQREVPGQTVVMAMLVIIMFFICIWWRCWWLWCWWWQAPSKDWRVSVFLLNGEKQGGRNTETLFDSSTRRSQRLWKDKL